MDAPTRSLRNTPPIRLHPEGLLRWFLRPRSSLGWLVCVATLTVLMLGALAVFNYRVDARLHFSSKETLVLLRDLVMTLREGKAVALLPVDNIEQRELQRQVIVTLDEVPACVVLGSSRVQFVEARHLGYTLGERFFNHSVPAAGLRDMIGILGLYEQYHGALPAKVVIGLDLWMMNREGQDFRWIYLADGYWRLASCWESSSTLIGKWIESAFRYSSKYLRLVDFAYTRVNLQAMHRGSRKSDLIFPVELGEVDEVPYHIVLPDGSRLWSSPRVPEGAKSRSVAIAEARRVVRANPLESRVVAKRLEQLSHMLSFLREEGVEAVVFLPPMHPEFVEWVVGSPFGDKFVQLEARIEAIVRLNGAVLRGSFVPESGLTSRDFFDASHPARHVYDALWAGSGGGND